VTEKTRRAWFFWGILATGAEVGLGYGGAGVPGLIPFDAVLIFEVELLDVRPSEG